jgi:hypothetical protein
MQNYIMLTPKNTYFSMHILFQELKQLLQFVVYNLKGKINLIEVNLLRKVFVSNKRMNSRIVFE